VDSAPPLTITPTVQAAYEAAKARLGVADKPIKGTGSLRWLAEMYFRSKVFARLNDLTQRERRSVLNRIVDQHGPKPFALMEPRHVEAIRDEVDGEPANKRVKCLRYLFKWAINAGHAKKNPAKDAALIQTGSTGYTPWTREDILQFEECHPIGTKARLALALFLYTGQRRSDVVGFGPLTIRGGRLKFIQHKGRDRKPKRMSIPLIEPQRQILDASPLGGVTYLETAYGQPFSIAGFGSKFRAWCDEAGLQGLSAHGIRKATGIIAAERGATAHEIMAILGHSTLEEAERYTRMANEAKLADSGFAKAFGDGA
jgi:integrase